MEALRRIWTAIKREDGVHPVKVNHRNATADDLRQVLKHCPICAKDFLNHFYALFATTVFAESNKNHVRLFFEALDGHKWMEAAQFQDWEALGDNMEAYALKCTNEQIALIVLNSPYELYERDSVTRLEVLNGDLANGLISFIDADRWKPFAA